MTPEWSCIKCLYDFFNRLIISHTRDLSSWILKQLVLWERMRENGLRQFTFLFYLSEIANVSLRYINRVSSFINRSLCLKEIYLLRVVLDTFLHICYIYVALHTDAKSQMSGWIICCNIIYTIVIYGDVNVTNKKYRL